MSKEKNISNRAKNSNSVTLPQTAEVIEEIKLTPDTTLSLTIIERGAFSHRNSNAASKKELALMKRSWVHSKTKKGEWQSPNGLPIAGYALDILRQKYKVTIDKKSKATQWRPLSDGQKPKNYYENKGEYTPPVYHSCVRKMNISNEALFFYASLESCPYHGKSGKQLWESMSITQRIYAHLEITAGTSKFTYEVIQ